MKLSRQARILSSIFFILFLAACVSLSPTAEQVPVHETAMRPASTLLAQTMTVFPAPTLTETAAPIVPTVTSTPLPLVVWEGLRVAYTVDGNVYIQDSGGQPHQLTTGGQATKTFLSDDGQKVVFYIESETEMNQLWVVSADGSGKQMLVGPERLSGYDQNTEPHAVAFAPGTHLLLLNTHLFSSDSKSQLSSASSWNNGDLLLVDTNTGVIRQLVKGVDIQGGFFLVSPNGKWVAVQSADHVDVIDLQGRFILRNLVEHSSSDECNSYGYICAQMFWTRDSSQLILVEPLHVGGGFGLRSVWRYSIDGRPAIQITFNPGPMGEAFSISPDGNWIAYGLYDSGQDAVYLGNLQDGTSQLIYSPEKDSSTGRSDSLPYCNDGWSPDSVYFICDDDAGLYFMNIHGEVIQMVRGNFSVWVDNTHYLSWLILHEVGQGDGVRIVDLPLGVDYETVSVVFLPRK